jgi:hypothetical protein
MTQKKKIFTLLGVILLFSFFLSQNILGELAFLGLYAVLTQNGLSTENLMVTEVERRPLLALRTGSGTDFALYSDGVTIWKTPRSPTGYCSTIIPGRTGQKLLDLAKDLPPGVYYNLVAATDQPTYIVQYGGGDTEIYGDPNTLFSPLPGALTSLFNCLRSFDYPSTTPWLPTKVHVEFHLDSLEHSSQLTSLSAKLHSLMQLKSLAHAATGSKTRSKGGTVVTEPTTIELDIPVAQYKNELLELMRLPKSRFNREVLVNGAAYRVFIGAVDGRYVWYL